MRVKHQVSGKKCQGLAAVILQMRNFVANSKCIFTILWSRHRPSCCTCQNQYGALQLVCAGDSSAVVERQKTQSHSYTKCSPLLGCPSVSVAFLLPRKKWMLAWLPSSQSAWVEGWKGVEAALRLNWTSGSALSPVQGGTFAFPALSCSASGTVAVLQAEGSC